MPAYMVVLELADEQSYAAQRELLAERVQARGGRYLVRGAPAEVAEGGLEPRRVAVVEFENLESAQELIASDEYA